MLLEFDVQKLSDALNDFYNVTGVGISILREDYSPLGAKKANNPYCRMVQMREQVEEITMDLSPTMRKAARFSFPNATLVADRFHVQKLALDALQELRIRFRWDALDEENRKKAEAKATGKDY